MKKIIFFIYILLSIAEAKAQSDLYDYIMNTVKPTHFPERNIITIEITNSFDGSSKDNQPVLVINDVVQMESQAHRITIFTSMNAYTMAQVQSVYIWRRRGDIIQNLYGGGNGHRGVIFVYTKDYVFPNLATSNIPRRLGADTRTATRIVVLENPIPAIENLKKKGGK